MKDLMTKLHGALIEAVLFPVKLYRKFSARRSIGRCKYLPTCSQYCLEAVREWGIIRGLFLATWRILRCNPFSKGGYDPVPVRKRRRSELTDKET